MVACPSGSWISDPGSLVPLEGSWFREQAGTAATKRKDLRKQRRQERQQKRWQRKNMRKQRRQQQARQQKRKQKRKQKRQQRKGLWKWLKHVIAKQKQQMKQCSFASRFLRDVCKSLSSTAQQIWEMGDDVRAKVKRSPPESFCSRGSQVEFAKMHVVYKLVRTTELRCILKSGIVSLGFPWKFVREEHEAHLSGTCFDGPPRDSKTS